MWAAAREVKPMMAFMGVRMIVSVRVIQKPGAADGWAAYDFQVKDTGIGMSQEFLPRPASG